MKKFLISAIALLICMFPFALPGDQAQPGHDILPLVMTDPVPILILEDYDTAVVPSMIQMDTVLISSISEPEYYNQSQERTERIFYKGTETEALVEKPRVLKLLH